VPIFFYDKQDIRNFPPCKNERILYGRSFRFF